METRSQNQSLENDITKLQLRAGVVLHLVRRLSSAKHQSIAQGPDYTGSAVSMEGVFRDTTWWVPPAGSSKPTELRLVTSEYYSYFALRIS